MSTEPKLETPSPSCSPQEQEVSLLDQIKYVVEGHRIDDVAAVAMMLLTRAVVQVSESKFEAMQALSKLGDKMAVIVDRDYDELIEEVAAAARRQ
jgi:hypothetical protein